MRNLDADPYFNKPTWNERMPSAAERNLETKYERDLAIERAKSDLDVNAARELALPITPDVGKRDIDAGKHDTAWYPGRRGFYDYESKNDFRNLEEAD